MDIKEGLWGEELILNWSRSTSQLAFLVTAVVFKYYFFLSLWLACICRSNLIVPWLFQSLVRTVVLEVLKHFHPDTVSHNTELAPWPVLLHARTHSSTLAWKIPWTEEPGRLQSMGSLRVGHD